MATDELVRVGVTGDVYVAPVGTALPTTATGALNAAFEKVGHLSPDALTEALEVTAEKLRTWQKKAGVRTVTTEVNWTFQFVAMETSPLVLEMYYGGAATTTSGGNSTTEIPLEIENVQKAMVIEIIDGDITTRYALAVVEIGERGEVKHTGSEGSGYDMTVSVVGDSTSLGKRITNDPAFAALAS